MPRSLSTPYLRQLLDPNSDVFGLIFIELSHPDLAVRISVVNDVTAMNNGTPVNYVLDGKAFTPYPFDLALFADSEDIAETKITIQNVDRVLGQAVDSLDPSEPLRIEVSIYASSDFALNGTGTQMVATGTPTLQYHCPLSFIRNITWDASALQGTVRLYDPSREPAVFLKCSPDVAPGLFM